MKCLQIAKIKLIPKKPLPINRNIIDSINEIVNEPVIKKDIQNVIIE